MIAYRLGSRIRVSRQWQSASCSGVSPQRKLRLSLTAFYLANEMKTIDERFDEKVKINPVSECHEWVASRRNGYGQFGVSAGNIVYAHRYSFERAFGNIKEGMFICHKCDNRSCVNPDHLFSGSQDDNMKDCLSKGRISRGETHSLAIKQNAPSGNRNGSRTHPEKRHIGTKQNQAKLTDDAVKEMREMRISGMFFIDIANSFNVSEMTAWRAINRKTWRHVA